MSQYDIDYERNTRRRISLGTPCSGFSRRERCEECEAVTELRARQRKAANAAEKGMYQEKISMLSAKSKIFVNAINLRDENEDFPARIYVLPPTVYDEIMNQAKGVKQIHKNINVFDPAQGCRIVITRTGQGIQTRYRVQIDPTPESIPNINSMNHIYNLDDVEGLLQDQPEIFCFLEPGVNTIRVLPPWDDRRILYKEVQFHRFNVNQVSSGNSSPFSDLPTTPHEDFPQETFRRDVETVPNVVDTASDVDNFFGRMGASAPAAPAVPVAPATVTAPNPVTAATPPVPQQAVPKVEVTPPIATPNTVDREAQIQALLAEAEKLKGQAAG